MWLHAAYTASRTLCWPTLSFVVQTRSRHNDSSNPVTTKSRSVTLQTSTEDHMGPRSMMVLAKQVLQCELARDERLSAEGRASKSSDRNANACSGASTTLGCSASHCCSSLMLSCVACGCCRSCAKAAILVSGAHQRLWHRLAR